MFKVELKRAIMGKPFKISLFAGICICVANILNQDIYKLNPMSYKTFAQSAFDLWIIFDTSITSNLIVLLLPILSSIVFSDTYLEDSKSGFLKYIYTRENKKNYLISKFFANFVMGGVVYSIPLILHLGVLLLIVPSFYPNPILGEQAVMFPGLFYEFYYTNPCIYILSFILVRFLFAGAFASIGLALGIFIKNKFVILVLPFMLYIILEATCEIVGKLEYSPLVFLYNAKYPSPSVMIGEFLFLLIASFCIFTIGGNKSEIF